MDYENEEFLNKKFQSLNYMVLILEFYYNSFDLLSLKLIIYIDLMDF